MPQPLKPGLAAEHVMHPLDRAGLQAVVDKAAGVLGRGVFERLMRDAEEDFYLLNLADNTRLGPTQGASVYNLVADVAHTLGLPVPNVFLDTSPGFKPRTLGGANPCLVLPSALIDVLPDAALRAAVGHELGYIVCGHSFYRLLAENFTRLSQLAGVIPWVGPILSAGLQLVLLDWYRKAALSADRVALLGTQDPEAIQHYLMWSAGASTRIGGELSAEGLALQAAELRDAQARKRTGGMIDRLGYALSEVMLQQVWNHNPWPAVRLGEITIWADSKEYRRLLAGEYAEVLAEKAPAEPLAGEGPGLLDRAASFGKYAGGKIGGLFGKGGPPTGKGEPGV
jgi:Zn-dependent protease with chaperone function